MLFDDVHGKYAPQIAVSLLKESGQLLLTNAPSQYGAIGVSFDSILKEGKLEKRVINLIEDLYGLARAGYALLSHLFASSILSYSYFDRFVSFFVGIILFFFFTESFKCHLLYF